MPVGGPLTKWNNSHKKTPVQKTHTAIPRKPLFVTATSQDSKGSVYMAYISETLPPYVEQNVSELFWFLMKVAKKLDRDQMSHKLKTAHGNTTKEQVVHIVSRFKKSVHGFAYMVLMCTPHKCQCYMLSIIIMFLESFKSIQNATRDVLFCRLLKEETWDPEKEKKWIKKLELKQESLREEKKEEARAQKAAKRKRQAEAEAKRLADEKIEMEAKKRRLAEAEEKRLADEKIEEERKKQAFEDTLPEEPVCALVCIFKAMQHQGKTKHGERIGDFVKSAITNGVSSPKGKMNEKGVISLLNDRKVEYTCQKHLLNKKCGKRVKHLFSPHNKHIWNAPRFLLMTTRNHAMVVQTNETLKQIRIFDQRPGSLGYEEVEKQGQKIHLLLEIHPT